MQMNYRSFNLRYLLLSVAVALCGAQALAADDLKEDFNPVETGVTSLSIAPDARGASMGDLGAATEPDANSQFWNPSKYAFAYSRGGVSISYTPWLRKLVNDIFLANLSGYWKFGSEENQAVSASLRYFSLGEVTSSAPGDVATTTINPYEMAFDIGYSRKLSEKFSMGIVFRYIYSDLGYNTSDVGDNSTGASAFSADISGYFTTYPIIGQNECQFSWGFDISNIGTKVSYDGGNQPAFLPTNLRLGMNRTVPFNEYNKFSVAVDANKLLVPTFPKQDTENGETESDYTDRVQKEYYDVSPIAGIFKSFHDAPNGFKEEMQEIQWSVGCEYTYNDRFMLRGGYHHESANKGNRKYFTVGAGFHMSVFTVDAAYVFSTSQTNPLDQTMRFTLGFDLDGMKDLFGRRRR